MWRKYISSVWSLLSIAVVFTAIVVAAPVHASTITAANDYPTSLSASGSANHLLIFTTPSGVSEGETITVTFSSGFSVPFLTEDDIDIEDDGSDLTTATDCSGTEQASASLSGNVVTVTICSGDGGAIAAASEVAIEIGTNATSFGTGSLQITNPTTTGTHFVSVAGSFGDVGSIVIPIISSTSVSISAQVPGESPSGGPSPSPSIPVISGIVVSGITGNQATVSWATSESATSNVDYGLTTAYESGTETVSGYRISHSVTLSSLTAGETYHIQIHSSNASSEEGSSSDQTFSTPDDQEPVISNISVVDVTQSSARVTWDTDESSDSTVHYGLTDSYGSTITDLSLDTSHSIILTGLDAGTTYYFLITSSDVSENIGLSTGDIFLTESDPPPSNVSGLEFFSDDSENILSWTNPTDLDFSGTMIIACLNETPSSYDDVDCTEIYDDLLETYTHSGLVNDTTYYYGVFAYDNAGQFASGALGSGTPSATEEEPLPEPESEPIPDSEPESLPDSEPEPELTPEPGPEPGPDSGPSSSSGFICGDFICSDSETSVSCPADCSLEEIEGPSTSPYSLSTTDLSFYVAEESIELSTTSSGVVEVLPALSTQISVLANTITQPVDRVELRIGSDTYLMSLETVEDVDMYVATVVTPTEESLYASLVNVLLSDESSSSLAFFMDVQSLGLVFASVDDEEIPLDSVRLTLFEIIGNESDVWDGSPYNQFNPVTTSYDGTFAWYVSDGFYKVLAQREGYKTIESPLLVISNGIVNPVIEMEILPPEEEEEEEDEEVAAAVTQEDLIDNTTSGVVGTFKSTVSAVQNVVTPLVVSVEESLEIIREFPGVEEAAGVSLPALAVTAGTSIVVLTVAFDFLPFLQYIFTAPILILWRRKRKGFGVIYNAITKTPVDLAVVRLFRLPSNEPAESQSLGVMVKSRVTDKKGRYFFLVQPGQYRITVTKQGFIFPSEYLANVRDDGEKLDVYHSEVIEVTESNAVVAANIPMDPSQSEEFHRPARIIWSGRLRVIQHSIALGGVITSIVFAIIRPNVLAALMIVLQIGVYFLARRLAAPKKPKSWGIIHDKETGRPISRVIARIFEPKYHKLLETRITDSKGRYSFLLGPNEYYAVFEKAGYQPEEVKPIDFRDKKESREFSKDINLLALHEPGITKEVGSQIPEEPRK